MMATMSPATAAGLQQSSKQTTVEVSDPKRAQFIKSELVRISKELGQYVLTTGVLLREYKGGGYYKEDGFAAFNEAIESWKAQGLIDYGARQARHLIAVVDMVEGLSISPEEINKLGISKLREIASLKDPQQQLALLGSADQKSFADIQAEAKQLRDKAAGRETDPLDPITLLMSATQKQFYKDCIERGRKLSGLTEDKMPDVAILVDVILADWMSGAADGDR